MPNLGELRFDVATGINLGTRARQEDMVVADFPFGAPVGFAVLSDGMGGHSCGDVASGIVTTEMFSELKLLSADPEQMERALGDVLREAVTDANRCINHYERQNPETHGMGATLIAPVLFENRLYWISIGDSPLYLFRDHKLYRLNEDHSYAAQIDRLLARGLMSPEEAKNHPDRSALLSVLAGVEIAKIDCRTEPMTLQEGDIVLAASDGLHTLSDSRLARVLSKNANQSGAHISESLIQAVTSEACQDQDNLSLCVIKVTRRSALQSVPVKSGSASNTPQVTTVNTGQVVKIDRNVHDGTVRTLFSFSRKVSK
ncbi:PP2C family protein-serine/threonine phosphatase [Shimia sp.]|uniref:PP2C family protein-serine/threonine phosphatase n=1 Tax=Shimia sp. TaxID=1954381 RepID=UPI003B8C8DCD